MKPSTKARNNNKYMKSHSIIPNLHTNSYFKMWAEKCILYQSLAVLCELIQIQLMNRWANPLSPMKPLLLCSETMVVVSLLQLWIDIKIML